MSCRHRRCRKCQLTLCWPGALSDEEFASVVVESQGYRRRAGRGALGCSRMQPSRTQLRASCQQGSLTRPTHLLTKANVGPDIQRSRVDGGEDTLALIAYNQVIHLDIGVVRNGFEQILEAIRLYCAFSACSCARTRMELTRLILYCHSTSLLYLSCG